MEQRYKCANCGVLFPVEDLVYHTDPNKRPLYLFCGVTCSFEHYMDIERNNNANKDREESSNN